MTTKAEPTVEKWVESIKQTCFDCIDYDGETVTWQSVLDKYLTEIVSEIKAHSVQEAKAERDGEWVKALKTTAYTTPTDNSTSGFIERVVKAIDLDLLASLKQEEEV